MITWFEFATRQEAQDCLDFINSNSAFPITCTYADTGLPCPDHKKIECWAEDIYETTSNKFVFESLISSVFSKFGESGTIAEYLSDYTYEEKEIPWTDILIE